MLIKTLEVGHLAANCYIVTDEDSLECAVIDPGDESNTILDYLESNGLKAKAVFLTHGHFDHVGAAEAVSEETGAPIWMNAADASAPEELSPYMFKAPEGLKLYREGDLIKIGGLAFLVLETPGHSPGSVTLLCGTALFTGDTLFRDSCGRTDLPGGDMEILLQSLRRLAELEGDYEVYPGHAEATSLNRERAGNYYMKYATGEI